MAGERFGPYELHSLLGRGGMGEVYRATDTRKDRGLVALKRLPVGLAEDVDFQRRFLREAQLAARLREPHIIPIHDYGQIQGRPFLEMRLVDGLDLASVLAQQGRLDPPRAVHLLAQVAAALDAAHREGLVHRDVKPSNVLLDRSTGHHPTRALSDQFVYLIDFGIAANVLASHRSSSVVSGTAAYMAPERFSASGGDHRADIYALGCMLYELLVGGPPFDGDFMQLDGGAHQHRPAAPLDLRPRPAASARRRRHPRDGQEPRGPPPVGRSLRGRCAACPDRQPGRGPAGGPVVHPTRNGATAGCSPCPHPARRGSHVARIASERREAGARQPGLGQHRARGARRRVRGRRARPRHHVRRTLNSTRSTRSTRSARTTRATTADPAPERRR